MKIEEPLAQPFRYNVSDQTNIIPRRNHQWLNSLDQAEILQLLSENCGEAFKSILQASLNRILQAESSEQLKAEPYERSEESVLAAETEAGSEN